MKVIKKREELRNLHSEIINETVFASLELDINTIEEYYENQSDEYGPLIIFINDGEQKEMEDAYPLIKQLEPEDFIKIYEDDKVIVERTCYILTDGGYIVYIKRKKV